MLAIDICIKQSNSIRHIKPVNMYSKPPSLSWVVVACRIDTLLNRHTWIFQREMWLIAVSWLLNLITDALTQRKFIIDDVNNSTIQITIRSYTLQKCCLIDNTQCFLEIVQFSEGKSLSSIHFFGFLRQKICLWPL